MVFSSSRRQHAIALSSGESEYYAATQGAADLLHVIEVMKFLGVNARGRIQTDSSACTGMASMNGVGRVRHLETRALWLQDVIDSDLIGIPYRVVVSEKSLKSGGVEVKKRYEDKTIIMDKKKLINIIGD